MKRLRSKDEIKKGQRGIKILVGVVLVGLMLLSTVGFAFFSSDSSGSEGSEGSEESTEQGNFIGGKWVYYIGEEQFAFTNYIGLVEDVPVDFALNMEGYHNSPLFIVSDNDIVSGEIVQNIGRYASRVQEACYGPCEKDLPEKNCDENLIIYKESDENKVYQEENCVFIEGDLIAVDSFLYKILGFY